MARARSLASSPWGIPFVLVCFALAAVVGLFGPLDSLVLQPLPFRQPQELVRIGRVRIFDASEGRVAHRQELRGIFSGVAAYWGATASWSAGSGEVRSIVVTGEFFSTLGVDLRQGRGFTADSSGNLPEAVVGYRLGRKLERSLGTGTIRLDGREFRVVGVAPRGFAFPGHSEVWELAAPGQAGPDPLAGNWVVIGRLRAGISMHAAAARLLTLARAMRDAEPAGRDGAVLESLHHFLRGDQQDLLWSSWAAALALLLLSCGGAASMALARGARQRRAYAVRLVLGLTPRRLARDEVVASLGPALTACAAGVFLAYAGGLWWRASVSTGAGVPTGFWTAHTLEVAAASALLVAVTTAVSAAAPAWQVGAGNPARWLCSSNGERGGHALRLGTHEWLTTAQLSLALVLVACAALLAGAATARARRPLGFRPGRLIVVQSRMPPTAAMVAFQQTLRAHSRFTPLMAGELQQADRAELARDVPLARAAHRALASLPGVAEVGCLYPTPFGPSPFTPQQASAVPMRQARYEGLVTMARQEVSGNAFDLLGMQLLAGRTFKQRDRDLIEEVEAMPMAVAGSGADPLPAVPVVVNRALARRLWPEANAVGKRIWTPDPGVVIGVVADAREGPSQSEDAPMVFELAPPATFSFLLKPQPGARFSVLAAEAARALQRLSPGMAPPRVSRLADQVGHATHASDLLLWLFGAFAALGLLAASLGVYGSTLEAMMVREQEYAIRASLGARQQHLYGLAAQRAGGLLAVGLPVAALGSWLLARGLGHVLHGGTAVWAAFAIASLVLASLVFAVYLRVSQAAVLIDLAARLRE